MNQKEKRESEKWVHIVHMIFAKDRESVITVGNETGLDYTTNFRDQISS